MDLREVPVGTQHPPISILQISALTVFYNMPAYSAYMCFKCNFIYKSDILLACAVAAEVNCFAATCGFAGIVVLILA